jgi:hypothetical protein
MKPIDTRFAAALTFCGVFATSAIADGSPHTQPIPISNLIPTELASGGGSSNTETARTLRPGRIHAASMTVTAEPGATCDIRSSIVFDPDGDGLNVKTVPIFQFLVLAGPTDPQSQTASYSFTRPIELNFKVLPNSASEQALSLTESTSNSVGICRYSGVAVYEAL